MWTSAVLHGRKPHHTSIEPLEARTLLSSTLPGFLAGGFYLTPWQHAPQVRVHSAVSKVHPLATGSSTFYSAQQIRHAYGFDTLSADGTGQTIAIVDAYDESTIFNDLIAFDKRFGLPGQDSVSINSYLTRVQPQGRTRADSGWGMEIALNVEWAHAIAPKAKIMLVEARSASLDNLLGAVDYASSHGASVVSMSWGAGEFSSESSYDYHFNKPGVTFVAASGDSGTGTIYPAVSPNVLAVGGTHLLLDAAGNYPYDSSGHTLESAWSGSGGGNAQYEPGRKSPDVAYDADPNTGFMVYDGSYYGYAGWWGVGGTSAGSPQWAALVALADQQRGSGHSLSSAQVIKGIGASTFSATAFNNTGYDLHDITSGSNGYAATTGFDLATGKGSPFASKTIADLVALA